MVYALYILFTFINFMFKIFLYKSFHDLLFRVNGHCKLPALFSVWVDLKQDILTFSEPMRMSSSTTAEVRSQHNCILSSRPI